MLAFPSPSRLSLPVALALSALAARASPEDPAVPAAGEANALAPPPAFAPGEEIVLSLDYLHVHAGVVKLVLGRPEGAIWPVICQARTDGAASLLDIREHFVSYWDAETRASRGSELNALEIGDRHTDRARFDPDGGKAVVQIVRKGRLRESTHDVPRGVQDLASALLFLRLQRLEPGARFEIPVFHGTSTFALQAVVQARERVETPAGPFDALRVQLRLGLRDRFETRRDSYLWLTDDARHVPVRMTADFAVGSMTATLSSYRPGGQLSATR